MADNKVAPESIELQTQPKPASAQAPAIDHGTQRLVDIDDTVDVEKADKATDGVLALGPTPAETEEAPVVVTVADKAADEKPPGLFSNLNLKKMGDATKIVMAAFLCILAGSTIALAVIVGVGKYSRAFSRNFYQVHANQGPNRWKHAQQRPRHFQCRRPWSDCCCHRHSSSW